MKKYINLSLFYGGMGFSSLTETQTDVLLSVASRPKSATEISRATSISLPYVTTILKLLEAKGYLHSKKNSVKGVAGKPKTVYSLSRQLVELTVISSRQQGVVSFDDVDESMMLYFALVASNRISYKSALSCYYWSNCVDFELVDALALVEERDGHVELLALTSHEHLERLRPRISNETVRHSQGDVTFACWVHTLEELSGGVSRHDDYYTRLVSLAQPLFDKKEVFGKLGVRSKHE